MREQHITKTYDGYLPCSVKQNLAFTKMGPLCSSKEKHDVDLGSGIHATGTLDKKFFSIQLDGRTDAGISENELCGEAPCL